jgi:hypothetical protein
VNEYLLTMTDGAHLRVDAESVQEARRLAEEQGYDVASVEPWLRVRYLRTTGLQIGSDTLRES